jgi:hypothetical protein
MTALIQQQAKYEREGYSLATYKHLQTNSDTGKIYRHYPDINGKEHRSLKIAPPSEDLREAYEKRSDEYTEDLNTELLEDLLEAEAENEEQDKKDPQWVAEDILDSGLEDYIEENHGQKYISRQLIELDYNIGSRRSKKVKVALKRDAPDELIQQLLDSTEAAV